MQARTATRRKPSFKSLARSPNPRVRATDKPSSTGTPDTQRKGTGAPPKYTKSRVVPNAASPRPVAGSARGAEGPGRRLVRPPPNPSGSPSMAEPGGGLEIGALGRPKSLRTGTRAPEARGGRQKSHRQRQASEEAPSTPRRQPPKDSVSALTCRYKTPASPS